MKGIAGRCRGDFRGYLQLLLILILCGAAPAQAEVSVTTVDFLEKAGFEFNAAGPLLLCMDPGHNRLVVSNTLSSSLSVIDCTSESVQNIPLGGRTLQHLKSEALTVRHETGDIYLIGTGCFYIVSPRTGKVKTVPTSAQFESIAVDEATGNVFIVGRESKSLGFYDAASDRLRMLRWLKRRENLINLNMTPPPPVRKVVTDEKLGQVIAVDGYTSTLHIFDTRTGKKIKSRPLGLSSGGRWHLAGYDQEGHNLFLVTETDARRVIEAAKIDVTGGKDIVVGLPGYTEGVGIIYNPVRDEVYVPYDNHPSVHVVDFRNGGVLDEIKVPAYGNDASAVDFENDLLFIGSWAFGEVDVVDLSTRKLRKRITDLGIIPHMFAMAFNPNKNLIYFPKGATAVNGTFGTAVSVLDHEKETIHKIYTGWAPVDLIELKRRGSFLVFNSEDEFAEVRPNGSYQLHRLPFDYPVRATYSPGGDVYLSYGPHQTYWPVVYIWDAKDGVLTIDSSDLSFYDRRIPRQAHELVLDADGVLYFTQNNWGREEQFIGLLEDEVRVFEANRRIALPDTVEREITQRILRYDPELHLLYLVRVGELDEEPSVLQVIDPGEKKVSRRILLGRTATDLLVGDDNLYVANFDSRTVSVIDKERYSVRDIRTGEKPLMLCRARNEVYVINHVSNTLGEVKERGKTYKIPYDGLPDNLLVWNDRPVITSHSEGELFLIQFDPESEQFSLLHREEYPYGDTRFDSGNVSFYVRGQFGDALFAITRGRVDAGGRLWVTDFLSGKLFILEADSPASSHLNAMLGNQLAAFPFRLIHGSFPVSYK
ncbi:MAG: YncE family protein [Candidatus Glassbacteria bacterium]